MASLRVASDHFFCLTAQSSIGLDHLCVKSQVVLSTLSRSSRIFDQCLAKRNPDQLMAGTSMRLAAILIRQVTCLFRVGGDSAHRAANTPKRILKRIGHWRSDVIEDYSRSQLEAMSACVENQDVDCPLLQVCDPAMPTYPETKGMSLPGKYIINDHSCLECP